MRKSASIVIYLIDAVFALIGILLGLRILLKLFGANAAAPFVDWIYETTTPLLAPFAGIFPTPAIRGGFVIEFSAVFALVIYTLVGYIVLQAIDELVFLSDKRIPKSK